MPQAPGQVQSSATYRPSSFPHLLFSRMRSRRVPGLRLWSRGPGGDARSLRCVRKALAKRSRRVGHAGETKETKIVAKRSTVVTFGLVSGLRVSKVSTVTRIGRVVVAKPRIVVTFGLASGERKAERREEKREMRGEKRGERREEKRRVDRRKERGERRQERGEERREETR